MGDMKHGFFTSNGLKWIAIIAMAIDHVAYVMTLSLPPFIVMHLIGRFTMPTMCFLMAEGFYHTRSHRQYATRLLIFACIAQVPFSYLTTGNLFITRIGPGTFNVLFCLLAGFCALWTIKSSKNKAIKIVSVTLCIALSAFCDWPIFGVLWILAFGLNRDSFKRKVLWFAVFALIMVPSAVALGGGDLRDLVQASVFLTLPLLYLYNGKRAGGSAPAWLTNKWIFYVFYPAHIAVIGFLSHGLGLLQ